MDRGMVQLRPKNEIVVSGGSRWVFGCVTMEEKKWPEKATFSKKRADRF
jgi:hypothetical protein